MLVRLGLGLVAAMSLAVVVASLSNALLASSLPSGAKALSVATDDHAPAKTLELGVAEVATSSYAEQLGLIERARNQIPSLVANQAIDWSALTSDDLEFLPTSFDDVDQLVLFAGLDAGPWDSTSLANTVGQLARADTGSAGYSGSGGGGWGTHGGGGGGVTSSGGGGGGSLGAGSTDGVNGAYASGSRDAFSSRDGFNGQSSTMTLGVQHGGNHDVRGEQAAAREGAANNAGAFVNSGNGANGRGAEIGGRSGAAPLAVVGGGAAGNVSSVPEPSTMLLMAAGLSSLAMSRLRRKAKR